MKFGGRSFFTISFFLLGVAAGFGLHADESGQYYQTRDIPLVSDPVYGRINLVGFPLSSPISWAEVLVVDGRKILSLDESDPVRGGVSACARQPVAPSCVMSRVMHRWNGNAWQAFNGVTPGMEGMLEPFASFHVTAMAPGIALRIPSLPVIGPAPVGAGRFEGWKVRLTARSDSMEDRGNMLGQIKTALDGQDAHDLEEPPPLGDRYLSIVFQNPDFPLTGWGYTSDFRAPATRPWGEWPFVVKASDDVDQITLSWEGDALPLYSGWLIDLETGEWIRPFPGTSYSYSNGPHDRNFIFALYNR